ncbi:single-stranded DNA-binding protein [Mycoplasma bovis]|uniref:single-stranded DNA-binding protein n=1 Tax=Mycoplasmopsis bovis TaxID=28903 RepID=UPI001F408C80|nr:single-stranded DNA-binding protein [Mycoplasmopsis bovis]MBT1328506.1 single-stranded DNA-binding protein [Mycoplasmopsis bovis]UJB28655.1 single-stranded DNA-binding protein [Mycoplasmopsis bovis]
MSMRREDNNTIVLSGNVVNDEYYLKEFKSNKDTDGKLLKLKLHSTSGNKHNYFDIALWNANAQFILEKVKKNDLIEIIGHLESGSYSKDNEKVYFLSIVADKVKIIQTAYEVELEEKREIIKHANTSSYSAVDVPTAEGLIEDDLISSRDLENYKNSYDKEDFVFNFELEEALEKEKLEAKKEKALVM